MTSREKKGGLVTISSLFARASSAGEEKKKWRSQPLYVFLSPNRGFICFFVFFVPTGITLWDPPKRAKKNKTIETRGLASTVFFFST